MQVKNDWTNTSLVHVYLVKVTHEIPPQAWGGANSTFPGVDAEEFRETKWPAAKDLPTGKLIKALKRGTWPLIGTLFLHPQWFYTASQVIG